MSHDGQAMMFSVFVSTTPLVVALSALNWPTASNAQNTHWYWYN